MTRRRHLRTSSILRNAASSERTQPLEGELYVQCRHVDGTPATGLSSAHVLRAPGGVTKSEFGAGGDAAAEMIGSAWLFLCDACVRRHADGSDGGRIVGTDGRWPAGARVTYSRLTAEDS